MVEYPETAPLATPRAVRTGAPRCSWTFANASDALWFRRKSARPRRFVSHVGDQLGRRAMLAPIPSGGSLLPLGEIGART
jgi:hypothetical protein